MRDRFGGVRRSIQGTCIVAGLCLAVPASPDDHTPPPVSRVRVAGAHGHVVASVLEAAVGRLRRPECAQVFGDFATEDGTSLRERLRALEVEPADYLRWVVFADGSAQAACAPAEVLAVTSPGSRVVRVCAARFGQARARDPRLAEAILIHEALHTLGLGENPPDSRTITAAVLRRCGAGQD